MTIALGTFTNIRYHPELVPDTQVLTIPAGAVYPAPFLDLHALETQAGVWANFGQIATPQDGDVVFRLLTDDEWRELPLRAVQNLLPETFDIEAINNLSASFRSVAPKVGWRTWFNMWVTKPTIAQKLARDLPLTPAETALAGSSNGGLGITDSVAKGIFPLGRDYIIMREYVGQDITETFDYPAGLTADVPLTVRTLPVARNKVYVLTGITADPYLAADNMRIRISRDNDYNLLDLQAHAIGAYGTMIPMWIPATKEIRIVVEPDAPGAVVPTWRMKITYRICRLTNTLRARWGLPLVGVSQEVAQDLINKVKGGVL